jgi:hypothetical protein
MFKKTILFLSFATFISEATHDQCHNLIEASVQKNNLEIEALQPIIACNEFLYEAGFSMSWLASIGFIFYTLNQLDSSNKTIKDQLDWYKSSKTMSQKCLCTAGVAGLFGIYHLYQYNKRLRHQRALEDINRTLAK